jgi:hypothetical protein
MNRTLHIDLYIYVYIYVYIYICVCVIIKYDYICIYVCILWCKGRSPEPLTLRFAQTWMGNPRTKWMCCHRKIIEQWPPMPIAMFDYWRIRENRRSNIIEPLVSSSRFWAVPVNLIKCYYPPICVMETVGIGISGYGSKRWYSTEPQNSWQTDVHPKYSQRSIHRSWLNLDPSPKVEELT